MHRENNCIRKISPVCGRTSSSRNENRLRAHWSAHGPECFLLSPYWRYSTNLHNSVVDGDVRVRRQGAAGVDTHVTGRAGHCRLWKAKSTAVIMFQGHFAAQHSNSVGAFSANVHRESVHLKYKQRNTCSSIYEY